MKKLLMTAGAAVLALSTAASAATLTITGGTAGTIPGGTAVNDLLAPLGFSAPLAGFYESEIVASGFGADQSVFVEVLGFEAGFLNTFATAEASYTSTGGATPVHASGAALASWVTDVSSGLEFAFATNGAVGTPVVMNGDTNDDTAGKVNFFASQDGDYIYLWMDDGGADKDDNHDDLVVRLSIVPLPAGAVLLLTGLGALVMRRRMS